LLHLERKGKCEYPLSSQEALEVLLCTSLRNRLARANPPDDTWKRIASRVVDMGPVPLPALLLMPSWFNLTLAVRAMALSSLLLIVGLAEVDRGGTVGPLYNSATPAPIARHSAFPEDVLYSYVRVRHDSDVRFRLGGPFP